VNIAVNLDILSSGDRFSSGMLILGTRYILKFLELFSVSFYCCTAVDLAYLIPVR